MRVRPLVGAALGSLLFAACSSAPENGATTAVPDEDAGVSATSATGEAIPEEHPARPSRRMMSDGLLAGMARYHAGGPQVAVTPTCANPKLSYFGGPLLQSPTIIAVFWSASVNVQLQSNMAQFYADVTVSTYWPWLQEYDSVGLTPGTNQAILPGSAPKGVV